MLLNSPSLPLFFLVSKKDSLSLSLRPSYCIFNNLSKQQNSKTRELECDVEKVSQGQTLVDVRFDVS